MPPGSRDPRSEAARVCRRSPEATGSTMEEFVGALHRASSSPPLGLGLEEVVGGLPSSGSRARIKEERDIREGRNTLRSDKVLWAPPYVSMLGARGE
jgi:hypothetical protein